MTKFAVICASNQNRSMEAHYVLSENRFDVCSYGTGNQVRLPGPSVDKPNVYSFGTPYQEIFEDLMRKDARLYSSNGLLNMLDRNRKIKRAPQKWHEEREKMFDVILTCESKCFDSVCEDLLSRDGKFNRSCHVINLEIKDNHEAASVGARLLLEITKEIEARSDIEDIDNDMENILNSFLARHPSAHILHNIQYY
jgi:RNA polymerase II subunit A C-terminal domain phosphatase SSU72